jgi:hypothetical protein
VRVLFVAELLLQVAPEQVPASPDAMLPFTVKG